MGKVKNWAMDNAEKFLSNLESQINQALKLCNLHYYFVSVLILLGTL
tara:strand:- start:96 stop:236 length:141 start_codon:yes stop_codon:yes gene_type:complete